MLSKIVCTVGPSSEKHRILKEMAETGMDVARINLSHGGGEWHMRVLETLREIGEVTIMIDLPGPKIRIGDLKAPVILRPRDRIHFTIHPIIGDGKEMSVSYHDLPREVNVGDSLFINDGLVEVKITGIDERFQGFSGVVISGGEVVSRKGLNAPGALLSARPPTDKDVAGIEFGIKVEADWFATSFVRDSRDVDNTRQLIEQRGGDQPIISKIEHRDAIKNIDEIIEASDAIMVARGDLGVEMPPWEVPILQKRIIKKCNRTGKPVIIATQMLPSMVGKPRPTRAEVSDVTNAIIDGADAVMLSEETAIGLYPVEAVKAMKSITLAAKGETPRHTLDEPGEGASRADVIGSLLPWVTETLKPAAIIVVTRSGFSARMVSRHRPRTRIIAVTRSNRIEMRMRLYWGVETLDVDWTINRDELLWRTIERCLERGLVVENDVVLVVSGSTLEAPGKTSSLEILKVTDVLKKREG